MINFDNPFTPILDLSKYDEKIQKLVNTIAKLDKDCSFVCKYQTDVKMNKTNNPHYGKVKKEVNVGCANSSYIDYVQKKQEKLGIILSENEFVPENRPWGSSVSLNGNTLPNIIINEKTNELYLTTIIEKSHDTQYIYNDKKHKLIELPEDVRLLVEKTFKDTVNKKQLEAGLEKENQVRYITVKLSNILEIC